MSQQSPAPSDRFAAIDSFAGQVLPHSVASRALPVSVGVLTGLHSPARGRSRGLVVIIPGFTGAKEDYADLLPLLAEQGWDAWAYSQRGQADSAGPRGIGAYRLEDFAGDATEVVRLLGDGQKVHLVGHSFGGLVARAVAIEAPELFRSLTLLCSGPRGWGDRAPEMQQAISAGGSLGLWNFDNPEAVGRPDDELTLSQVRYRERASRTSDDNISSVAAILRDEIDRTDDLLRTGLAVHVLHGELDDGWPIEWQRQMARRLGAHYGVIPGLGHTPQEEDPEATAHALLEFWT
ncbi:alpha/beta fold hydrolase [uncultured Microbacterium sp.]|uniref:alpha/beta fold hydrolase n=1 Tax=uncultured Microbacterium sp. TaxID=191216 RepID=UPI0035CA41DB